MILHCHFIFPRLPVRFNIFICDDWVYYSVNIHMLCLFFYSLCILYHVGCTIHIYIYLYLYNLSKMSTLLSSPQPFSTLQPDSDLITALLFRNPSLASRSLLINCPLHPLDSGHTILLSHPRTSHFSRLWLLPACLAPGDTHPAELLPIPCPRHSSSRSSPASYCVTPMPRLFLVTLVGVCNYTCICVLF